MSVVDFCKGGLKQKETNNILDQRWRNAWKKKFKVIAKTYETL
jgi:hypothetical protein